MTIRDFSNVPLGVLAVVLMSCSSSDGERKEPASSGGANSALSGAAGTVTGGAMATGGSQVGLGGAQTAAGTGGNSGTGGTVAQGGFQNEGGRQGTGGTQSFGGYQGTGGQSAGAGQSSGGAEDVGGRPGTGGVPGEGGAPRQGGAPGIGGTPESGGSNQGEGGVPATGGQSSAGGSLGSSDGTTPITVWIAGDSTVMTCSSACPCGWGMYLGDKLNDAVTVVNSAVGGRSIRSWLYTTLATANQPWDSSSGATNDGYECDVERDTSGEPIVQDRWAAMLDGMSQGDYLLIQFGINDGACPCDGTYTGRCVTSRSFIETLGMMAQAAKERGTQPVFVTSPSAADCVNGNQVVPNRGFVTETQTAGTTYDVPVINLTQLSADLYNSLGVCPHDGDFTSTMSVAGKFFCDDHTHFSDEGAPQIAEVIVRALADQGIGLASYVP